MANAYFPGQRDLMLLRINLDKLAHEVRYEDTMGAGECFPHIYGPLNLSAVIAICPLGQNRQGQFAMPEDTAWKALESGE